MTDDLGIDLNQLLAQRDQRPVLCFLQHGRLPLRVNTGPLETPSGRSAPGGRAEVIGDDEQAVSAYRACLESTDPDSAFMPVVRVWLAVCLASAGHHAEARSVGADVLRLDPNFRIDDWWQSPRKDWTVRERAVEICNEIVSP